MSYLYFDKSLVGNLQESLTREVLRANRSGAYHCTSLVGCNTRKYHGLLVIPVPEIDDDNHVLLSSLDVSVIQHGAEFNLGLHQYQGNHFSPNGHKYIRCIESEKTPVTTYRVGGVILQQEKIFVSYENRILIRYTLVDAHSATTLRFKPYLAFRSVREYTHENSVASRDYRLVENGISTKMYDGYPELFMQLNKQNNFVFQPDWYKGIEYLKERERGYYFDEDLYVPGYFEVPIKKGESIVFSAGITETKTHSLKTTFQKEEDTRIPRNNFYNCLRNSAHQFFCKDGDETYIIAGYPWFKCRARDLFISLPGMSLSIGEIDSFHKVMKTAEKALREFMDDKPQTIKIYEIEHPDILLWAIWCIQQYALQVGMEQCLERYGDLAKDLLDYIQSEKHPNIVLHNNGLLSSEGKNQAISWMNATHDGKPITPRTGYLVENNSLYFNALCFVAKLYALSDEEAKAHRLNSQAEITAASFRFTFLNKFGYLFDYVDGEDKNWCVRPNMLFATCLEYSPLDKKQRKKVLDFITRELLTPKGIRSLSPKSDGYNPNYIGPQAERDFAYHNGTAWPWLLGFYLQAYLKLYRLSGISFAERHLIGLEEEMSSHCIGSIPEVFDGNPPFKGRGAISFAMNVGGILKVLNTLTQFINKEETQE